MHIKNILFCAVGCCGLARVVSGQPSSTNATLSPAPPRPQVAGGNQVTLTPTEWQELRVARQQALKANPELLTKMIELSKKMHEFEVKLHAAMVEANPNVATTVARVEGRTGGMGPHTQSLSPPSPPGAH